MIKNSSKQTGSIHIVIMVILVVIILCALGFVVWKNFLREAPTANIKVQPTTNQPDPKKHKSEIVVLKDGDMNKYVNYEGNFTFLFPKQIYSANACTGTDTKFDNYGNKISSDFHYGVSDGPIDITVLEKPDEYIIVPNKTIVLSSPHGSNAEGYIYKDCNILVTTTDLINESQKDNFGIKNISLEHKSFVVRGAPNKATALSVSRDIFDDSTGTVSWASDPKEGDREIGTFQYTPNTHSTGGFAYKLWYYPSEKKVVFFSLGQSEFFEHPDHSNEYYTDIVSSFTFGDK